MSRKEVAKKALKGVAVAGGIGAVGAGSAGLARYGAYRRLKKGVNIDEYDRVEDKKTNQTHARLKRTGKMYPLGNNPKYWKSFRRQAKEKGYIQWDNPIEDGKTMIKKGLLSRLRRPLSKEAKEMFLAGGIAGGGGGYVAGRAHGKKKERKARSETTSRGWETRRKNRPALDGSGGGKGQPGGRRRMQDASCRRSDTRIESIPVDPEVYKVLQDAGVVAIYDDGEFVFEEDIQKDGRLKDTSIEEVEVVGTLVPAGPVRQDTKVVQPGIVSMNGGKAQCSSCGGVGPIEEV